MRVESIVIVGGGSSGWTLRRKLLSQGANRIAQILLRTKINDLTSGFIIGNKQHIKKDIFYKSNYGEYFVYLVMDLISQKRKIEEIGYYCKPRNFGSSKTSNNIIRLITLGIPYIKAAYLCKKNLKTS